ncbi:MAG: hypothetical protein RIC56_02105 [Pseudomonadales bacterium]
MSAPGQRLLEAHEPARSGTGTELLNRHSAWTLWAGVYLALAAASLVLMSVDERLLQGVSVWTKPFKFQLSLAVYFLTLAWFASLLGDGYFRTWRGRLMTWIPIFWAAAEVAYITWQGAIGETSHFNRTTPFHAIAYSLMGLGAVTLVSVCLWMALEILVATRGRRRSPYVWAVVSGLALTFALGGGFGGYLGNQSGHWVNAPATDAGGLWLFGWTREGGDLRAAHFFGMHAMQVLPLIGWLLARRLSRPAALTGVGLVSLVYAAFTTFVFFQAIAGRPLLA